MILPSMGYSILTFTVFVLIIGVINLFTFKTYSLIKKGLVIIENVIQQWKLNQVQVLLQKNGLE